jgi:hypothetical protein
MTTENSDRKHLSWWTIAVCGYAIGQGLTISADWTIAALCLFFPACGAFAWLSAHSPIPRLTSGRKPAVVEPGNKPVIEPYAVDMGKRLYVPEPGPDQCPVCGAEDLPYYRDRNATVSYGKFDAHWTCAAWFPYDGVKAPDIEKPMGVIDGMKTYTLDFGKPEPEFADQHPKIKGTIDVNDFLMVRHAGSYHAIGVCRDCDRFRRATEVWAARTGIKVNTGLSPQVNKVQESVDIGLISVATAREVLRESDPGAWAQAVTAAQTPDRAALKRAVKRAMTDGKPVAQVCNLYRALEVGLSYTAILDTPSKIGVYDEIMRSSADEAVMFMASYLVAWRSLRSSKAYGSQEYAKDFEQTFRVIKKVLGDQLNDPFGTTQFAVKAKLDAIEGLISDIYPR